MKGGAWWTLAAACFWLLGATAWADPRPIAGSVRDLSAARNPSHIQIERGHLIVDFGQDELRVAELYVLSNLGSQAFMGDASGRTLQFLLPEAAEEVQVDGAPPGGRFILDEGSVWDTEPLPPGQSVAQHIISYVLPYDPDAGLQLVRQYAYPVARLNLLVPLVGVEVTCDNLDFAGTTGGAQVFQVWRGEGLEPGATWSVRFRGRPSAGMGQPALSTAGPGQSPFFLGGVAAGFLVLLGLMVSVVVRRRGKAEVPPLLASATQSQLVDELARLDNAFADGRVEETAYQQQREALKQELIRLLRQGPGGG